MSAHIIGRPDDDLLDILLGHGADPEQAFISGQEPDPNEGEAFGALRGEEATVPEPERPVGLSIGGFLRPAPPTGRTASTTSGSQRAQAPDAGDPVGSLSYGAGIKNPEETP